MLQRDPIGFCQERNAGLGCFTIFLAMSEVGRITLHVRLQKNVNNKFFEIHFVEGVGYSLRDDSEKPIPLRGFDNKKKDFTWLE